MPRTTKRPRWVWPAVGAGAVALVAGVVLLGSLLTSSSGKPLPLRAPPTLRPDSAARGQTWLLSGVALHMLLPDPAGVRTGNSNRTFLIVGNKLNLVPQGSGAIPVATYTRFSDLNWAIQHGRIDPRIKALLYDNESWSLTPKYEQLHPAEFERRAGQLAHDHGFLFISTPAVNLATVLDPSPGRVFEKFLRLGIARDAAAYADVIDLQAQGSQRNSQLYADFVNQATAQARAANPNIVVLAGLSTNPTGVAITVDDMYNVVEATRQTVDGYWLNIPVPGVSCPRCNPARPDIALELLHRLYPS